MRPAWPGEQWRTNMDSELYGIAASVRWSRRGACRDRAGGAADRRHSCTSPTGGARRGYTHAGATHYRRRLRDGGSISAPAMRTCSTAGEPAQSCAVRAECPRALRERGRCRGNHRDPRAPGWQGPAGTSRCRASRALTHVAPRTPGFRWAGNLHIMTGAVQGMTTACRVRPQPRRRIRRSACGRKRWQLVF